MMFFDITLVLSALLCSLVAGFLFSYAIVVMPGIKQLDDKQFIKTFQITDRVIQDNHPVFLLVWVGSAISLIACAAVGFANLQGVDFILLLLATVTYLLGVQVATIVMYTVKCGPWCLTVLLVFATHLEDGVNREGLFRHLPLLTIKITIIIIK